MSGLQYINTTTGVICVVICLALLLCVITAEYRKDRLHKIFVSVVCCQIPLLLVDTALFILEGKTEAYAYLIFRICYFLSFFLGTVILILFTYYILTLIKIKTTISKRSIHLFRIAISLCCFNLVMIILTPFTGFYYTISDSNIAAFGEWRWLSQLVALGCVLLNTVLIFQYRKAHTKREFVFLLSYAALPTLAILAQSMHRFVFASIDFATTLTILIYYASIQSEQANRLKDREMELAEKRVAVMISQIQPHFLYNTLTGITRLCTRDANEAKQALVKLSKYLRGNMDSLTLKAPISVKQELGHLDIYLSLEKMRFGDRLSVEYDITASGFMLPALTIQPIVENAVRHGITHKRSGGTVKIATKETSDTHIITVTDDGVGFDPSSPINDDGSHVGIENVRNRLAMMCGGTLDIRSKPGIGTTAVITLPKGERNEHFGGR